MRFEIPGEIVPYTRVGQERWTKRAKRYFASKDNIGLAIKLQMNARGWAAIPPKTPFVLRARFVRRKLWVGDVDNLAKAVLDSAEGIAFDNDRYCVRVEAEKARGADCVEIEIWAMK